MSAGLYAVKPWFVNRLRGIEDVLVARNVSADAVTLAAVGVSALAGAAFTFGPRWSWLAVPVLCLVRLAFNALDGSIARRTNSARPWGTALNEICDRASDALLLGGLAVAAGPWALAALVATFFASLTGVLGLALAGQRLSGGPMGKADRAAVVSVAAIVAVVAATNAALIVAAWIVGIGALVTAGLRLVRIKEVISHAVGC